MALTRYYIELDDNRVIRATHIVQYMKDEARADEVEAEDFGNCIRTDEDKTLFLNWQYTEDERYIHTDESAKAERNKRLTEEVDPIVCNTLRWNELSSEKQAEWTAYRQNLLDMTSTSAYPGGYTWPTKPE